MTPENLKILVIDDHKLSQKLLSKQLEVCGVKNITCLSSAKEGLEILNTNSFDIIMCDKAMPGMDGLEFIKICRANTKLANLHIIVVSAEIQDENVLDALAAGADAYIKKPYNQSTINEKISNFIKATSDSCTQGEER